MGKYLVWSVEQLYNTIQNAIDQKFDFIVAIDGRRGLGKSTLGIKTAVRFDQFRMKKHILFERDEINKALAKTQKGVFVLDEMINVTHNRDFFSAGQKQLIKILNMYRDSGNVIFACVPNFAHLDNQFRDLVKMRIHIERRGLGVIHTPNQSAYAKDKWDMSINEKIEASWAKRGVYNPNYKRLTTYRGLINFGALGKKQQVIYDKVKFEKRGKAVELEEKEALKTENSPYRRTYDKLKVGHIKYSELPAIANALGIRYDNLYAKLKEFAKIERTTPKKVAERAEKAMNPEKFGIGKKQLVTSLNDKNPIPMPKLMQ